MTAPTCTDQGYTTYTCSACQDSYVTDYTAALGHSYEEVVIASTCTEQGYTTYICQNCGDSYIVDYTDATGHTDADDDGVCDTCGETYYYTFSLNATGTEYTLTGYTGSDTVFSLPSLFNGLPVTSIGNSAFDNCTKLTSVIFEDATTWYRTAWSSYTDGTETDVSDPETAAKYLRIIISIKSDHTNAVTTTSRLKQKSRGGKKFPPQFFFILFFYLPPPPR